MPAAVILYGPPAAGKDTITAALIAEDSSFTLFRRLKVGGGRTDTYRMATAEEVAELSRSGEILWQNSRYDATYVVDRPELRMLLNSNMIPVLHLGQAEAIDALRAAVPEVRWTVVELWCTRAVAEQRIRDRNTNDTTARLDAWDETLPLRPDQVDLRIDTTDSSPAESASRIRRALETSCRST
ncbi:kinase [Nocardia sp. 2]|uniref:Kinase n=1 Tax=Nocardia acididurans TaxID=2802282 RepID=A0ABS1MFN7_9NOCA|nr:kinase [Nocardia acididurans]MBL1079475.1 kinase [Nocardia acididurans]